MLLQNINCSSHFYLALHNNCRVWHKKKLLDIPFAIWQLLAQIINRSQTMATLTLCCHYYCRCQDCLGAVSYFVDQCKAQCLSLIAITQSQSLLTYSTTTTTMTLRVRVGTRLSLFPKYLLAILCIQLRTFRAAIRCMCCCGISVNVFNKQAQMICNLGFSRS